MRALLQRVSQASVVIEGEPTAQIEQGLLVLLGIEEADDEKDIDWLSGKIARMRIFSDEQGLMNKSVMDVDGKIIVVSQFTLHANVKKGNRPSFINAARPEKAIPLYETFVKKLAAVSGIEIQTGEFGANMQVGLVNDGPVSIWIDTKNKE